MTATDRMTTDDKGLKPCPFCGGKAIIQEHEAHEHSNWLVEATGLPKHVSASWSVECVVCSCGMIFDTEAEAIAAWNRRLSPVLSAEDAALVARLAVDVARLQRSKRGDLHAIAGDMRAAIEALSRREHASVRDAARWNALLRCARIRMFGSAGFDPKTGERQEYRNSTGEFEKSSDGWVHFGAEFWSVYPGGENYDGTNQWGIHALTALADDVLLKEPPAPHQDGGSDA